jgi:uncharacterized protein
VVIPADLAVAEDRDRLAARLEELGQRVEILDNNAGYGIYRSFVESGREQELAQLRLLVEAAVDLMSRYLPGMVERRRGAVINMSSSAGFQPLPYNAGYSAAKAYLLLFSEAVHAEVKEHGVTVTAVCPGPGARVAFRPPATPTTSPSGCRGSRSSHPSGWRGTLLPRPNAAGSR